MAFPNIVTGLILSIGRVSGETAPILFTAAAYFLPKLPDSIFDQVMALPYHLYVIATSGIGSGSLPSDGLRNGSRADRDRIADQSAGKRTETLFRPQSENELTKPYRHDQHKCERRQLLLRRFHALKNITLDIERNTVTAFIGPSGCGKSTFLRLLNRMNDLIEGTRLSGEIRIDGEDIYGRDVEVVELRKKVGMVFQKPNPFPKTIYENVAYGLRVNGVRDRRLIDERVESSLKGAPRCGTR